ncbi:MAG: pyridoxamine 5'-phosphate oxidase family protein [Sedimentisphaerales bacterium]|nr:pyridoxamine 5'-phosphate oxidase family protein [Sedimentisphaerales bacterium]
MNLADYFERTEGFGVLGTADEAGNVDLAVYARPHVIDETTLAFIMSDRLTHENLQSNPRATFLFHESGGGYKGKRLYLTRVREETDPERIEAMRRESRKGHDYGGALKFLVYFRVEKVRPLVGD